MPNRRQIGGGQRALSGRRGRRRFGGGLVGGRGLFNRGGDEVVDRARAGFGLVADRDGYLAADRAGIGLPVAEAAHIGHGGARQRHGLLGIYIGIQRRRFRAAWQQHANDAYPEGHSQQKKHDPTHYPRRLFRRL